MPTDQLVELRITIKADSCVRLITHTKKGMTCEAWFKENEGWICDSIRQCITKDDDQKEEEEETHEAYVQRKAKIAIDKRHISFMTSCKDDGTGPWIMRPEFRFETNPLHLFVEYNMYWHNLTNA